MPAVAEITPGSTVTVKVVKTPTAAAARKTLVRVLSKDAGHAGEVERLRKARAKNQWENQRGGRVRLWQGRQVKLHKLAGQEGETGTLKASPDVLRDLGSVEKFIAIEAA